MCNTHYVFHIVYIIGSKVIHTPLYYVLNYKFFRIIIIIQFYK